MNFVEALRQGNWIRRRSWAYWLCVKDNEISKYISRVTRDDLIAEDWTVYGYTEDSSSDDSMTRFSLLELE